MSDGLPIETSFEEMTVTSTPGSPIHTDGQSFEQAPNSKITFQVEVVYKDQVTKKAVRILPTSTMHDFIDKLNKKKYLPSTSALGGHHLKSEHITISYGKDKEQVAPFLLSRWPEPLWNVGFRDKDVVILTIDPPNPEGKEKDDTKQKLSPDEKPDKQERHTSFMGRFTRKSLTKEEKDKEKEDSVTSQCLFGVNIEEVASKGVPLMASYGIPSFIEESLDFIKQFHTETEGVFRLSGSLTAIKSLKKKIDAGTAPPFDDDVDVHCLTGLIKLYLRELPEPLLTYELYDCWKSVSECDIKEKKLELVKSLLLALPKPNYVLLKRLVEFFADLATYEKATKMGLVNLATLIGPNLIWSPQKDSNDISTPMKITWFMLKEQADLFVEADARSTILLAVGRAKYDFSPENEGEIHLRQGEIVFATANDEDGLGWLEGTTARSCEHGKFPSKYFETISPFSSFDLTTTLTSPIKSSISSLVASSEKLDNVQDDVTVLKTQLEEEIAARKALEQKFDSLQANFHDMVKIMITLKNHVKDLQEIVDEMNPFEDEDEHTPQQSAES